MPPIRNTVRLVHDETGRFDVAVHRATSPQFATLAGQDVALDGAVNHDGLRFDLAFNLGMLADGEASVGIDRALHFAVDMQFFLKFDRTLDRDSAR